jgi:hypothetical protein
MKLSQFGVVFLCDVRLYNLYVRFRSLHDHPDEKGVMNVVWYAHFFVPMN